MIEPRQVTFIIEELDCRLSECEDRSSVYHTIIDSCFAKTGVTKYDATIDQRSTYTSITVSWLDNDNMHFYSYRRDTDKVIDKRKKAIKTKRDKNLLKEAARLLKEYCDQSASCADCEIKKLCNDLDRGTDDGSIIVIGERIKQAIEEED